MARTDVMRWSDWRRDAATPLRPVRDCACGSVFIPFVPHQDRCVVCAHGTALAEKIALREPDQREADAVTRRLDRYRRAAGNREAEHMEVWCEHLKHELRVARQQHRPATERNHIRVALRKLRAAQERLLDIPDRGEKL
jgi:hypothetical protein